MAAAPSARIDRQDENISEPKEICRDFVWGTCFQIKICKFRHELKLAEMKTILKFCHDYQNRCCKRVNCNYLHISKSEQSLFLTSGQLPRVLIERYATLSVITGVDFTPQIASLAMENLAVNLSDPPGNPSIPPVYPYPPIGSLQPPPNQLSPPPNPPPQPPPLPSPSSSPRNPPPPVIYGCTAPLPPPLLRSPITFSICQPYMPLLVMFDASRPPPLLPSKSSVRKHNPSSSLEVGPSKIRKTDDSDVADTKSKNSIQRK